MNFTFDDMLIKVKFSEIRSRKDVSLNQYFANKDYKLPIISSNMDTVTNSVMANAMREHGAAACLHRFNSIEDNVKEFKASHHGTMVSVGIGDKELERAKALYDAGADTFIIDVAHGANIVVVEQYNKLVNLVGTNACIIVGNFANKESINEFKYRANLEPYAYKVGIGGGSACTTRVKTGAGMPQLSSIIDCYDNGKNFVISDGGHKTSGDIAKALGAGASMVMLGGMLAGTDESSGEAVFEYSSANFGSGKTEIYRTITHKKYRGSASQESYEVQGKDGASWRTAEGEAFYVQYKGPVKNVLQEIEGGVKSSLSYVGAKNLKEFVEKCEFEQITGTAVKEGIAHGKS